MYNFVRYFMRISREHDPDEPAEKRSKTVTNLAGITGVQRNICVWSCLISSFERHNAFPRQVLEVTQVRSQRDRQSQQANWGSTDHLVFSWYSLPGIKYQTYQIPGI